MHVRQEKVATQLRGGDNDWWERSPMDQLCTQIFGNIVLLSKYPFARRRCSYGYTKVDFEYLQVH